MENERRQRRQTPPRIHHKNNDKSQNNAEIQIKGRITSVSFVQQKRGKRMVASFEDQTGSMELVWFRGHRWIRDQLKINTFL